MNAFKLVKAFILRNPLTWAFHVLMLAVGVAVVLCVILFGRAVEDRLARDLAGVDLVVGAKGSPTQLILSTLFATDVPTGNIPLSAAQRIERSPLVRESVTLSLGDSVSGYRIVGTQPKLAEFYQAGLQVGRWWTGPLEVVLGSETAIGMKAGIGATFVGQHGLSGGESHDAFPYVVVGILKPTGAAIDRMVLTDTTSVWKIHEAEHGHGNEHKHGEEHDHAHNDKAKKQGASEEREVTAVLVRYKSAMGALMMPRQITAIPDLQAAIPAQEAARIATLTGAGANILGYLGIGLLALSSIGFCVALANAVHQRRSELALLRVLGIAPLGLGSIVLLEALLLGLLSGALGLMLGRAMTWLVATAIAGDGGVLLRAPPFGPIDGIAILCTFAIAMVAALIPAILAYRTDPALALKGEVG
jgi:putative ABC transport system permease protein